MDKETVNIQRAIADWVYEELVTSVEKAKILQNKISLEQDEREKRLLEIRMLKIVNHGYKLKRALQYPSYSDYLQ